MDLAQEGTTEPWCRERRRPADVSEAERAGLSDPEFVRSRGERGLRNAPSSRSLSTEGCGDGGKREGVGEGGPRVWGGRRRA